MEYYEPREIQDENGNKTGKWHYTVQNSTGIRAVGHCSPWQSCPDCKGRSFIMGAECSTCNKHGVVKSETPCPGHDTPDEAVAHYYEYVLDKVEYNRTDPETQMRCKICAEWTQNYATSNMSYEQFRLCERHCNREHVDQLMQQSWKPKTITGPLYS